MHLVEFAIACGALVSITLLMIPIMGIMTFHRRKLEEMRLKHKLSVSDETAKAIEAVREEFKALRDTTTQYDMSFDSALHRIESRMGNVEQRVLQLERGQESARLGVGQENHVAVQ